MLKTIAAFLGLLLLGGCTGAADNNISFGADSPKALAVIGLEGLDRWGENGVTLIFRGIDASGATDRRSFSVGNGGGWITNRPAEYFVVEAEPGSYIAEMTLSTIGSERSYVRYCDGTWKFTLAPGQVTHIGNFLVPPNGDVAMPATPRFEAAAAKLAEYPQVQQKLIPARLEKAAFPQSRFCDMLR
jgi:hypothetical protein